ncbi:hypothetical protein DL768_011566 [Monosporascus sp. mg162]|nr:hypothetical protein DL768_011566 [Monosporascus sp. mg162]
MRRGNGFAQRLVITIATSSTPRPRIFTTAREEGNAKKEQETPKPDTPVPVALLAVTAEEALDVGGDSSPVVMPRGGVKDMAEARRSEGVFVSRGREDHFLTRSIAPGIEVYGEKRVSVDSTTKDADELLLSPTPRIVHYEEPFLDSNFNLPDSTNFVHKPLGQSRAGMSDV